MPDTPRFGPHERRVQTLFDIIWEGLPLHGSAECSTEEFRAAVRKIAEEIALSTY